MKKHESVKNTVTGNISGSGRSGRIDDSADKEKSLVKIIWAKSRTKKQKIHKKGIKYTMLVAEFPIKVSVLVAVSAVLSALYLATQALIASLYSVVVIFAGISLTGTLYGALLCLAGSLPTGLCFAGAAIVCGSVPLFMIKPVSSAAGWLDIKTAKTAKGIKSLLSAGGETGNEAA